MKYLVSIMVILTFSLTSCDQCADVSCLNNGVCVDGTCDCPTGFSGASCEVEDVCLSGSLTCENGGECEDGECNCGEWYDGETCDEKVLERYDGTYVGGYTCNSYTSGYARFNEISSSDDEMEIQESSGRFYDAEFEDNSSFDIPNQTITEPQGGSVSVSGSGDISENSVTFAVTYNYSGQGSSTVNCVFTGSR